MLQYFMKDCPLPLTLGNFSDTDTYDLQPLRSYDELFIKEGIEIVVKAQLTTDELTSWIYNSWH